jgi:hypothetical protein
MAQMIIPNTDLFIVTSALKTSIGVIDDETRMRLLPKEQEMIKAWEDEGILLASYIKSETPGLYLV